MRAESSFESKVQLLFAAELTAICPSPRQEQGTGNYNSGQYIRYLYKRADFSVQHGIVEC